MNHPIDDDNTPSTARIASPRRRRLIKLGASSVPVALTLASRPAMAWHCSSTSAWGSAVVGVGGASAVARQQSHTTSDEGWSIAQWAVKTNPGYCAGWTTCGTQKYGKTGSNAGMYALGTLKCTDLYSSGVGGATTGLVCDYLSGKSTSDFGACLLVAKLNMYYGSSGVASCLTTKGDQTSALLVLNQMATGSYTPSVGAKAWNSSDIMNYLVQNWMVQ